VSAGIGSQKTNFSFQKNSIRDQTTRRQRRIWERQSQFNHKEIIMVRLTAAHISPIIAIIAGILILIMPRLLNCIIAIYLIVVGLIGLNGIYHFIH
jgi:hypothetical protein